MYISLYKIGNKTTHMHVHVYSPITQDTQDSGEV